MNSFITFLCTSKTGRATRILVQRADFMIGRGKSCAVCVPFPEVSRQHCRIAILPDQSVSFTDVRPSSVGIMHNGRYKKAGLLAPGDEFFIGDTRFVLVEYAANPSSAAVPAGPAEVKDASTMMRSGSFFQDASGHLKHDSSMIQLVSSIVEASDSLAKDAKSQGLDDAGKHLEDIAGEAAANETALGMSVMSGKTERETGDLAAWSDLTALSLAAQEKNASPAGLRPKVQVRASPALVAALGVCLAVAVIAIAVAFWALGRKAAQEAQPAAAAPAAASVPVPVPAPVPSAVPAQGGSSGSAPDAEARAALRAALKEAQAKRDALVQSNNEYVAAATLQDRAAAARIAELDVEAARIKGDPAMQGRYKDLLDERAGRVTDQLVAQEVARNYIRDNFTDQLRSLDAKIADLKAKLDRLK